MTSSALPSLSAAGSNLFNAATGNYYIGGGGSNSVSTGNANGWSVFVTNEFALDSTVWRFWLMGCSVENTVQSVIKSNPDDLQDTWAVRNFVITQYRNFELLEVFLHRPKHLQSQLLFPLPKDTKQMLIDSYYSFHGKVLREVLGKKLSSRVRKELDDAREKSGVPVNGCRRMFDNLKRIMKRVEDLEGDIVKIIENDFQLPPELARRYSNIIFINFYRLDTMKKKLASLQFEDFEYLGSIFMQYFTLNTPAAIPDIDSTFAQDCRTLKTLFSNHKDAVDDLRNVALSLLKESNQDSILEKCSVVSLRAIVKGAFSLGAGLASTKELRDIYQTLIEKLAEPCHIIGWNSNEADIAISAILRAFGSITSIHVNYRKRYAGCFERLFNAVRFCTVHLLKRAETKSTK